MKDTHKCTKIDKVNFILMISTILQNYLKECVRHANNIKSFNNYVDLELCKNEDIGYTYKLDTYTHYPYTHQQICTFLKLY